MGREGSAATTAPFWLAATTPWQWGQRTNPTWRALGGTTNIARQEGQLTDSRDICNSNSLPEDTNVQKQQRHMKPARANRSPDWCRAAVLCSSPTRNRIKCNNTHLKKSQGPAVVSSEGGGGSMTCFGMFSTSLVLTCPVPGNSDGRARS